MVVPLAVPLAVRELELRADADIQCLRAGELLFVKWHSSKVVYMLSTMRNESTETVTRRGQEKVKPSCVVSYNSQMDTVDRSDQMIQPYNAARKTFRW